MKIKTLLVSMLLATTPALTMAASASEQLRSFVQDVRAAKGEFSQRTVDSNGQSKGAPQSGQFVFQRPGQFKWHVQRPYEQLIVSDGKLLYQYDPIWPRSPSVVWTSPSALRLLRSCLVLAIWKTPSVWLSKMHGMDWSGSEPHRCKAMPAFPT